jgi:hypothetical protein
MYADVASKERNIPQPSKENYNCYLTIKNRTLFAYIKKKESERGLSPSIAKSKQSI